jgi:hypothetical protein
VTLFGRNTLVGLCICISRMYQLNHMKMEIADGIIYTLPTVKSFDLCHFPHTMNAITELQLVCSIVITCW